MAYQYVKTDGSLATTEDQANAPGRAPTSGFATINSANTTPTPTIQYKTPQYKDPAPIDALSTDYTPAVATPQETEASGLTTRLRALNDSLAGKSAYQTQQNQIAGVDTITSAINDNNVAVKQLQKEALAQKLRQENTFGTTGSTIGAQAQIDRDTAVKALTLSSISDVLQNNLVAAQHKADRAVEAEFGPLEAELKAKTANLQLLLNDPATTLADKNRAQKQSLILDAQKAQIAEAKDNKTNVLKLVQDAGQNTSGFKPTTQYPTLSAALNAMAQAKTPMEALNIQIASGLVKQEAGFELSPGQTRYDSRGNIIASKAPTSSSSNSSSGSTKPMGILDVQRYQELYSDAGVVAGDSEASANAKVAGSNSPEAKIRGMVVAAQANNNTYETVVSEINKDTTIKDKATALAIAKEVYAVEEAVVSPIEKEIARLQKDGILTNDDIKASLRGKYSQAEVNNSSVSSLVDKVGYFLFGN